MFASAPRTLRRAGWPAATAITLRHTLHPGAQPQRSHAALLPHRFQSTAPSAPSSASARALLASAPAVATLAERLAAPLAQAVSVAHPSAERPAASFRELSKAYREALELSDGAPPDMFMVMVLHRKQYKVMAGDTIVAQRIDAEVGERLRVDSVLLVGTRDATVVGTPVVPAASVELVVEAHEKAAKDIIYKKKRRKGYQRQTGHRQQLSILRVVSTTYDI